MHAAPAIIDGRRLLADHADMMEFVLVHRYGRPADEAEARITHLWDRWVHRVMRDHHETQSAAETIMDEGIAFFAQPRDGRHHGPRSEQADWGWETMILYTQEYAALCDAVHGTFVHHRPNDVPGFTFDGGICAECDD